MDPLFPYTTLFRSLGTGHEGDRGRTPLRSSWAAIRHPRRDTTSVGEQQGGPHIRQYVSAKFRHLIDVRTERHPSFRTSCLNQAEARLLDLSPEPRPGSYRLWLTSPFAGDSPFTGGVPGVEGFGPARESASTL